MKKFISSKIIILINIVTRTIIQINIFAINLDSYSDYTCNYVAQDIYSSRTAFL